MSKEADVPFEQVQKIIEREARITQQQLDRQKKAGSKLDPKVATQFDKPANFCQLCDGPVEAHQDSTIHKWQQKWSTHWSCKELAENQLDRATGILSERK